MKIVSTFLSISILTSFITTIGFGRIILSDIFSVTAMLIFMIYVLGARVKVKTPDILIAFYFLLIMFAFGIFTSLNLEQTLLELLILFFLSLFFMLLITVYQSEKNFLNLIFLFAIVSFLTSFTGIWDTLSLSHGLPRFFPRSPDITNVAVSGFKNSGQAGAYMLMTITIIISIISTPLYKKYSKKQQIFFKISLFTSILFLFLTVKLAAYIGFFIGIVLFALKKRNMSIILISSFFVLILILIYINLERISPGLYEWMMFKTHEKLVDGTAEGFISNNLSNALAAFNDNLFFGTGIGGFAGVYEEHEVHSTYFKIIGETGLIGLVGYMVFMIMLFKMVYIKKSRFKNNPYAEFLSNMQPFFIGFLVSWGYTYHLRKREFWIMVAIIYLAYVLAKKYQRQVGKTK